MRLTRRQLCTGAAAGLAVAPLSVFAHDGPHAGPVIIRDFVFEPEVMTIRAGTVVEWTNGDFAPHTATADDGSWDTGELAKGDTGKVLFDRKGEFGYFCAFHPHMKGRVVVT